MSKATLKQPFPTPSIKIPPPTSLKPKPSPFLPFPLLYSLLITSPLRLSNSLKLNYKIIIIIKFNTLIIFSSIEGKT